MDKEHKSVPYIVYEDNQAMAERNMRRSWMSLWRRSVCCIRGYMRVFCENLKIK